MFKLLTEAMNNRPKVKTGAQKGKNKKQGDESTVYRCLRGEMESSEEHYVELKLCSTLETIQYNLAGL